MLVPCKDYIVVSKHAVFPKIGTKSHFFPTLERILGQNNTIPHSLRHNTKIMSSCSGIAQDFPDSLSTVRQFLCPDLSPIILKQCPFFNAVLNDV